MKYPRFARTIFVFGLGMASGCVASDTSPESLDGPSDASVNRDTGSANGCSAGLFVIEGTIDGRDISESVATEGRSLDQVSSPATLDVIFEGGSLHLEFDGPAGAGMSVAASGSLSLPNGELTIRDLCVAGTLTIDGDEQSFTLSSLSMADDAVCPGTAVAGQLMGCATT